MITSKEIGDHLAAVIDRTRLEHAPFDHMALEEIFPPEAYAELLAMLPQDHYYRELKHSDAIMAGGRSARLQFPLLAANIDRLPPAQRTFWKEIVAGLNAPKVEQAWRAKFNPVLESMTGRAGAAIKFQPHITLFRDLGGYKISIHPDSPRKAITIQYYLPADESQVHLGTVFHDKDASGGFREARAMRFAPNTGYSFAVTPKSYHSVKPMSSQDRPRNSLMVIMNYDRGPLIEGFKAGRARLRAWYDKLGGRSAVEAGEGKYEQM
ncbi:MAG: hypothetical protein EXR36_00085 [Betaproteobacteria bacterium]|nr:hypothetical protein [Betaproteobacteria bacterium]